MIKNYDKVVILTKEDTYISLEQWQQRYELEVGSASIGKYYKFTEGKFLDNIKEFGKLVVCEPLIKLIDVYREKIGEPNNINSFNRDQAAQDALTKEGFRTAKVSPHVEKMAADNDAYSEEDTRAKAKLMIAAARELGYKIRIGYEGYLKIGQTFIHCDVCPMYYGKGMPRHDEPHPVAWEFEQHNMQH